MRLYFPKSKKKGKKKNLGENNNVYIRQRRPEIFINAAHEEENQIREQILNTQKLSWIKKKKDILKEHPI